jgi:hypothetical protein
MALAAGGNPPPGVPQDVAAEADRILTWVVERGTAWERERKERRRAERAAEARALAEQKVAEARRVAEEAAAECERVKRLELMRSFVKATEDSDGSEGGDDVGENQMEIDSGSTAGDRSGGTAGGEDGEEEQDQGLSVSDVAQPVMVSPTRGKKAGSGGRAVREGDDAETRGTATERVVFDSTLHVVRFPVLLRVGGAEPLTDAGSDVPLLPQVGPWVLQQEGRGGVCAVWGHQGEVRVSQAACTRPGQR